MMHKHHIVPQREGGSDDPSNIIICTPEIHAYLHRVRYAVRGDEYDRIAAESLSGMIGKEEILKQIACESGFRGGSAGKGKVAWNKGIQTGPNPKLSIAKKGKNLWSQERKDQFAKKMQTQHPRGMLGKTHSKEACKKIAIASQNRVWTNSQRQAMSERMQVSHPRGMLGKTLSPAVKFKLMLKNGVKYECGNVTYLSCKSAAEALGISEPTIRNRVRAGLYKKIEVIKHGHD